MKLSQFQFDLPADRIATEPTRWRDEARLMVLHKNTGEIEDATRMFNGLKFQSLMDTRLPDWRIRRKRLNGKAS